jgi:hypothetical protein
MKMLIGFFVLCFSSLSLAQNLPRNSTCQDLVDASNGKLSRTTDGGKTYVPVNMPHPTDTFGQALLSNDTYLCQRLSRKEISVEEFNALHGEKVHQLQVERARLLADRQRLLMEQKNLQNQERALQNQRAAIQTQKEAIRTQQQAARIQAVQAEMSRRQQEAHHQELMQQQRIQLQQLEQIRQEQAQPKTLTCFGSGGYIQCN